MNIKTYKTNSEYRYFDTPKFYFGSCDKEYFLKHDLTKQRLISDINYFIWIYYEIFSVKLEKLFWRQTGYVRA